MTTDWRVQKIYELMSDPTTPGSAVHDEFISIMNRWKIFPLAPFFLFFWKGEWVDFDDFEKFSKIPSQGEMMLENPVYFKVYSWDDSTWCFSAHPHLESRVALLETRVPALFNIADLEVTTEKYGKIVLYDEEKVTRSWQDMIDKYEPQRQAKIFGRGFADVWSKMSKDVEDWAKMTNNEAVLDSLDGTIREHLARGG